MIRAVVTRERGHVSVTGHNDLQVCQMLAEAVVEKPGGTMAMFTGQYERIRTGEDSVLLIPDGYLFTVDTVPLPERSAREREA